MDLDLDFLGIRESWLWDWTVPRWKVSGWDLGWVGWLLKWTALSRFWPVVSGAVGPLRRLRASIPWVSA